MRIRTTSATQTEGHGARFAQARPRRADLFAAVYLSGELGAGKTTWARGFLGACGVQALVRSPTYTLVELYRIDPMSVLHLDLYRLQDAAELEPLGVRDWAQPGYLWLIEWPERAVGHLPPPDLRISFSVCADAHEIAVAPLSWLGEDWLGRVPT